MDALGLYKNQREAIFNLKFNQDLDAPDIIEAGQSQGEKKHIVS